MTLSGGADRESIEVHGGSNEAMNRKQANASCMKWPATVSRDAELNTT
jgi:hypothetical protein